MNLYPSVTEVLSILDPIVWSHKIEAAALRGTTVHEFATMHAQGFPPMNIPPEWEGYYESFAQWYNLFVKQPIAIEERLAEPEMGFHGKPDLIFLSVEDELCLADYKTGAATQKKWLLQIAAYDRLASKAGHHLKRAGYVKLNKDGTPAAFVDTLHLCNGRTYNLFLSCLNLYRFLV
jgi:hypothetical protein